MILKINEAIKELKELYESNKLIPFIGAGFSIPLKLPSWRDLIIKLGNDMGYIDDLYLMHGNYQQLAEYAKLTDDKKWNNFLLNIAADFNSKASRKKRKKSKQHIALSKLKIKIVYTTNYDRHIEGAFEDSGIKVKSIVSIKDFLKEDKERYEMEVIKFHGCLTEPKSIILTEKQYYERMELEDALDQRLRSDTLSNSFLFIGYSFDDPNIRYIWYKINAQKIKYHSSSSGSDFRPSYIATFGMNEIQARILEEFNIKVIALNPINKEEQISQLLTNII